MFVLGSSCKILMKETVKMVVLIQATDLSTFCFSHFITAIPYVSVCVFACVCLCVFMGVCVYACVCLFVF